MNPKALKAGDIPSKAEFIIDLSWPDMNPNDIDTWAQDPAGNLVWFRAREAGLLHLGRDDRGLANDVIVVNGNEIVNPLNQEVVTLRGVEPGEFTVNAHYYDESKDGRPVEATVSIIKVNPRAEVVFYGQVTLACKGDASLLPLEAGPRWTYDVATERESGAVEHEILELRALGEECLGDSTAWRRRSDSGVEYWLRIDASGVYRVAAKSNLDADPVPDKKRRHVLKSPLAVGSSWQGPTTAYLLQRRQEFPREIRHTHPVIPMSYTIEAVGEEVDTRAGRFDGCLRVKGTAILVLFADPVSGWTPMPLTTIEWYCPGAGFVKLERREPAKSSFIAGGRLTMKLITWQ